MQMSDAIFLPVTQCGAKWIWDFPSNIPSLINAVFTIILISVKGKNDKMQRAFEPNLTERKETESLLHSFLAVRAKTDSSLTVEQSEDIVSAVKGGESNSNTSTIVGRRLAEIGTYLIIGRSYYISHAPFLSIQRTRWMHNMAQRWTR